MLIKLLFSIILSLFFSNIAYKNVIQPPELNTKASKINIFLQDSTKLRAKAEEALKYCIKNNMSNQYCVLIDMNIHSGKKRLFLWDFNKKNIVLSGLCSHGCGNLPWGSDESKENPKFSNISDSHLSSLGKYKIGKRGWSNWGIHINYKLHGLDKTNDNAYRRVIVLHSWEEIGADETFPNGSPEGWGCPAVNNSFMKELDQYLQKEKKPLLLWIYD